VVVTCQPQIRRESLPAKDRRPNHRATQPRGVTGPDEVLGA